MRLYWVRHGQMELPTRTDASSARVNGLINQAEDRPLTLRGRAEAQRVADALGAVGLDAVYTSPTVRTRETAAPTAAAVGSPPRLAPEVLELLPGDLPEHALDRLRGMSRRDAAIEGPLIPTYFFAWLGGQTRAGETPRGFRQRLRSFLDRLEQTHSPDARVAVFSHGFVTFFLAGVVSRPRRGRLRAWRHAHVPNGAITEFRLEPGGRLVLEAFARTDHLGEG